MSRSRFDREKYLQGRLPKVPAPTLIVQKISQSLPLLFHLCISSLIVSLAFFLSFLAHLIDGPILNTWCLRTSLLHSVLKAVLDTNPPQGRHSLSIVRFATSFKLPNFLFRNSTITQASITVQSADNLSYCLREALDIKNLTWNDSPKDIRVVKGEWVQPNDITDDEDIVIFYLHGGAHTFMSPGTHRGITTRLANTCRASVFVPDYRLSPENPFPAGIEDVLAAYLALTQPEGIQKSVCKFNQETRVISSSKVFIMGDSSGCCLSLQLLQALRSLDLPMPAGSVMLSPFLDHKFDSNSWHVNWNSDFLSLDMAGVDWAIEIYSNGIERDHPSISPMYANLKNFPPMLIQSGDSEVVTDDAIRFHSYSMSHGNQVELQLYKHMFHVFHTFPFLPQVGFAFDRIATFLNHQKYDTESDSGFSVADACQPYELGHIYLIDEHNNSIKQN